MVVITRAIGMTVELADLLDKAMPYCDLSWQDLLSRLHEDPGWSVWRIDDDGGKILGVAVLVLRPPKCTLWAVTGRNFSSWRDEGERALIDIAKQAWCTTIECHARPGIQHHFSGWKLKKYVFEKDIG